MIFSSKKKGCLFCSKRQKAGGKGFEPLTFGFGNHYSTIETILLFKKHAHYRT